MTCPNCGHPASAGAAYCEQCGTPLAAGGRPSLPAWTPINPPPSNRPPRTVVADQQSRYWAIGAHLSALVGGFLGGLPAFLGPLIVWLVRKDADPYAAAHGRNALNFNLSVLLYAVALLVLTVVTFGLGLLVALPAGLVLGAAWLVLSIVGAVKAANDQPYRYPFTIPFVR